MRIATLTACLATAALLAGMMTIGPRPHSLFSAVTYQAHASSTTFAQRN